MKNGTAIICIAAVSIVALGLVITCDDNPLTSVKADFEVHEWGVMIGCKADTSFFLTSRPEVTGIVREPVIYIHSKDKTPFTAQVTFNAGRPTVTYPEAQVNGDTVVWQEVRFVDSLETPPAKAAADFVPLDSIIDILNDVDADCLEYDGQTARFLFYEGTVEFENKVDVTYDFDALQATFVNKGAYPVYNVIVAIGSYVGRTNRLNPGDSVTVPISNEAEVDLAADLVLEGFTEKEAQAFDTLWQGPFLESSASPELVQNLIYRLSQDKYDELITLDIDPQPDKTIRSLYILVHLYE